MSIMFVLCRWMTLLVFSLPAIEAIPRRAQEPWSIILCKFAELPDYEPRSREWVENWISGPEASIESYFNQVSNGLYTIKNSNVLGWYQLPFTQKEILRLANSDSNFVLGSEAGFNSLLSVAPDDELFNSTESLNELDQEHFKYFDKIKELCSQVASENGAQLNRQRITIVNAGSTAVYGKKYGVLLTPSLMFTSVLSHEMVHSFYIGHSYSDRKIRVFPYALSGEYDDRYDLMSTANAYMHRTNFGMAGPGLNAPHLDFLGWLPMDRMLYFGRDGRQNYTLRLSSLSVPHNKTRGWLVVMLPYDRDNSRNFYTIELRTPHNSDRGIGQASVLIHRVQRAGESYYSVLLSQARDFYELTEGTEWIKFLGDADISGRFQVIRVSVRKVYAQDADITVSSTFEPNDCRLGEIMKRFEGPTAGVEHVCLEKDRDSTEKDEQRQLQRRNFYTSLATYGANSCKHNYVWRSIDAYDYTCVEQLRKDVAQSELDQQEDRVSETGCVEPYLQRNAFPGDQVCVTPVERLLIIRENAQSTNHLKHFEFFNGVDSVGA